MNKNKKWGFTVRYFVLCFPRLPRTRFFSQLFLWLSLTMFSWPTPASSEQAIIMNEIKRGLLLNYLLLFLIVRSTVPVSFQRSGDFLLHVNSSVTDAMLSINSSFNHQPSTIGYSRMLRIMTHTRTHAHTAGGVG